MKFQKSLFVGAALACLLGGLPGLAIAEPVGKTDIAGAEALAGVVTNVPKMFKQMHGQPITLEARSTQEALDLFCAGTASLLVTDKHITSEAAENCAVASMTELQLGTYSFDTSLLTGHQRKSGDYDDLIARQNLPVLLYVNKDRAPAYKEFLDFITDETLIGDLGVLSDRGLTGLSKDEQTALRLSVTTLPDYAPSPVATSVSATAEVKVQTSSAAQAPDANQPTGAATAKNDAGSLSGFALEGVQPFMTCDQVEKVLTGQGYQRLMMAGFVKSGSKRILLGNPTCSGAEVTGVTWLQGAMASSACAGMVEPMLNGPGNCQDEQRSSMRGGPVTKRTCAWQNETQSIEIRAVSDFPRSPTKPETSDCRIEMFYP